MSIAFYPSMEEAVRKAKQTSKKQKEAAKEDVTVYFRCPAGLLKQVDEIAKIAGFMSKEEAIRQALREFRDNYTPEYYKASQVTEAQVSTMAMLWEKYPNFPAMLAALRAQSAGLTPP